MRSLAAALTLAGCVSVPPMYVPAGQTPWRVQMAADQTCVDLLAAGVELGERPTVLDRRGFHRDRRPGIFSARGPNVTCLFTWFDPRVPGPQPRANECVCDVARDQFDENGHPMIMQAHDTVFFNACHELHRWHPDVPDPTGP